MEIESSFIKKIELFIKDKDMELIDIFIGYVIPCIGVLTVWAMYFSSLLTLNKCFKLNNFDNVNPFPAVFQTYNGMSWIIYCSYIEIPSSIYCFSANIVPVILGIYYILTYYEYIPQYRTKIRNFIVYNTLFYIVINWYIIYDSSIDTHQYLGYLAVFVNIIYYISPLSTIIKICIAKDSKSISFALTITSFVNSLIWTLYGIYIKDYFLAIPNLIGVFSCFLQFLIKINY